MVECGLARKITWGDLSDIDEIYNKDTQRSICIENDSFSGTVSHSDAIKSIGI